MVSRVPCEFSRQVMHQTNNRVRPNDWAGHCLMSRTRRSAAKLLSEGGAADCGEYRQAAGAFAESLSVIPDRQHEPKVLYWSYRLSPCSLLGRNDGRVTERNPAT